MIGVVIDAETCQLVVAGLDGKIQTDRELSFPTPDNYGDLIDAIIEMIQPLLAQSELATIGIGLSVPGLIDYRRQQGDQDLNAPTALGHPLRQIPASSVLAKFRES